MYNPIDSCYKKAIELEGVIVTIGENQIKVLIRETSDNSTYGIDYKKIISATKVSQGNYVFINGVQFLIIDIEPQYSQSIYNIGIFRKTQEILLGSNYKPIQAIVDRDKITLVDSTYINEVHDQYTFIIPKLGNNTGVGGSLVYDGGIYNIISIDTSRDGLYYITGKYSSVYTPHTYAITLNSNSQTLKETETYTIVPTCTDNGAVVTSPTVIYTSSDTNIATVSSTGVVSCIGVGSATINCNYNNASVDFTIVVEAKPVEPVISYTSSWSNTTTLRTYSSSTMTPIKTLNGIDDSANMTVTYSFDSTGASLLSSGKITIVKKTGTLNSWTIKNVSVSTATSIHVTFTDTATGTKILDNQLISLTA